MINVLTYVNNPAHISTDAQTLRRPLDAVRSFPALFAVLPGKDHFPLQLIT
jgi:hypothetical protein